MSNPRVVICDPGVGNVRSVVRAIERATSPAAGPGTKEVTRVEVTRDPAVVRTADVVVVPGQGSFGAFVAGIGDGLGDALRDHLAAGRPYLGICLGMQVLFESSEEAPGARGLGFFRGHVRRLAPGVDPVTTLPYALPHIGWNAVEPPNDGVDGAVAAAPYFYFAHTFAADPDDATIVRGRTTYGANHFASAVARDAVMGVQFHPEKSQREGLDLLARFFGS